MDLRQVTYFMWVYESGSFTKAARLANIVQPALSVQIRRLEEELKAPLFVRTQKGIVATPLGKALYDACLPIVKGFADVKQRVADMAQSGVVAGAIRCGFPPTFLKAVAGRVVPAFTERHPGVDLVVREGYGGTLRDWVSAGELDFAFGGWSKTDSGVAQDRLFEEELVLVCGKPIAGPSFTPCDLNQIEDMNLILPSPHQVMGAILRGHIEAGTIRPRRTMIMDSYVGVMEVARASDWAVFVPVAGVLEEISSPPYIYPIAKPRMVFRWHLIHDERKPLSLAARIFVDMVAAEFAAIRVRWREICDQRNVPAEYTDLLRPLAEAVPAV
jgi:LysR family transcriptional regulator, nitrogen assimilation regulatory protein